MPEYVEECKFQAVQPTLAEFPALKQFSFIQIITVATGQIAACTNWLCKYLKIFHRATSFNLKTRFPSALKTISFSSRESCADFCLALITQ